MPVTTGKDEKGYYYRWGSRGKKFYYIRGDKVSRERAKARALEDRKRVEYFKHRGE